jgi:hypothetical protein
VKSAFGEDFGNFSQRLPARLWRDPPLVEKIGIYLGFLVFTGQFLEQSDNKLPLNTIHLWWKILGFERLFLFLNPIS